MIGEGSFAKVLKARDKRSNNDVAVKVIDKAAVISDIRKLEALYNEVSSLMSLRHPNIVRMLEFYETANKLCLIMELASGGELFDRIIERGSYSEQDASVVMLSLFRAVKYLHDKGIVHRDLKPQNILYETNLPGSLVKISDFGLSKMVDEKSMFQTCCGTPGYVSPEVLAMEGYGPEVDMWSLGVLMYVLLCGFLPFYDENENVQYELILHGSYSFPSPYWDSLSPLSRDLISRLLVVDPSKRLTAVQALAHPWFSAVLPAHHLYMEGRLEEQRSRAMKRWRVAVGGDDHAAW